jgi:hypothetical protein
VGSRTDVSARSDLPCFRCLHRERSSAPPRWQCRGKERARNRETAKRPIPNGAGLRNSVLTTHMRMTEGWIICAALLLMSASTGRAGGAEMVNGFFSSPIAPAI